MVVSFFERIFPSRSICPTSLYSPLGRPGAISNSMGVCQVSISEERDKAFQELWSIAYDRVAFAPLFGLDYVHGIDPKLKWTPRDDGFMLFSEMELSS